MRIHKKIIKNIHPVPYSNLLGNGCTLKHGISIALGLYIQIPEKFVQVLKHKDLVKEYFVNKNNYNKKKRKKSDNGHYENKQCMHIS